MGIEKGEVWVPIKPANPTTLLCMHQVRLSRFSVVLFVFICLCVFVVCLMEGQDVTHLCGLSLLTFPVILFFEINENFLIKYSLKQCSHLYLKRKCIHFGYVPFNTDTHNLFMFQCLIITILLRCLSS